MIQQTSTITAQSEGIYIETKRYLMTKKTMKKNEEKKKEKKEQKKILGKRKT